MKPTLVVLLTLASLSSLLGQDVPKKTSVPADTAQAEAAKLIKEVYGDEYSKAKTAVEKQALAKRLLGKASESRDDPAGQFVLLRLARDIASQASDGQTAFQAIDAMADVFQVDACEMKSVVLTKSAAAAQKPAQHKFIAEEALRLVDQAVSHENFRVADTLGKLALAEARTAREKEMVAQVQSRINEVAEVVKAFEEVKVARARLVKTPSDPDANFIVGKYMCFVKGDWDKGLPMLAIGKDAALKTLAKQELQGAASSIEQAKLGDGWWNLAEEHEETVKKQMRERAGYWYRKAVVGLSGLARDRVEKRLSGLVASNATSSNPQVRVRIVNRKSGMCLCLQDGGKATSQDVVQQPLAHGSLDQEWRLEKAEDVCWIANMKSGGCIAVSAAGKAAGAGIIDWPKNLDALEQQWQIKPTTGGYCIIINRNSGQCLAIPGASKSANAKACQWPIAGAKAFEQQWRIEVLPQHDTNPR